MTLHYGLLLCRSGPAGAGRIQLGFRPGTRLTELGLGEDTLLGWRVRRAGSASFAPDAVVHHHVFDADLTESLRRAWTVGAFPHSRQPPPRVRASTRRR